MAESSTEVNSAPSSLVWEEFISSGLLNSEWVASERRCCVDSLGCKPLNRLTEVVRSVNNNFFLSDSSKSVLGLGTPNPALKKCHLS